MGYAATPAAFSYAIQLSVKAVQDPAKRRFVLRELAGMDGLALSDRIDALKIQIQKNTAVTAAPAKANAVPGHYTIAGSHVEVKVSKLTKTPYVVKDGGYMPAKWPETQAILADVAANGKDYAIAYAAKTGKCGVCNTKLTKPKSIAAGIGPVCAKKF